MRASDLTEQDARIRAAMRWTLQGKERCVGLLLLYSGPAGTYQAVVVLPLGAEASLPAHTARHLLRDTHNNDVSLAEIHVVVGDVLFVDARRIFSRGNK